MLSVLASDYLIIHIYSAKRFLDPESEIEILSISDSIMPPESSHTQLRAPIRTCVLWTVKTTIEARPERG